MPTETNQPKFIRTVVVREYTYTERSIAIPDTCPECGTDTRETKPRGYLMGDGERCTMMEDSLTLTAGAVDVPSMDIEYHLADVYCADCGHGFGDKKPSHSSRRLFALVSKQGSACIEACVCSDCDTPNVRTDLEDESALLSDPGVPESWRDCTDNEALACCVCDFRTPAGIEHQKAMES